MPKPLLPMTNADGLPVVPMSEEQKYTFDLKGWICLPGLLSEEELIPVREHQMKFLNEPETLPPDERDNHGGASQILLDHPVVVGVLNEIISHQALATEDCYGFRFDHTYTSHRRAGHDNFPTPWRGWILQLLRQLAHLSNATRENPRGIDPRRLGIERSARRRRHHVLIGQSQSRIPAPRNPQRTRKRPVGHVLMCAGSAVIFTEALCHTGTTWGNEEWNRLSLFTCYNTVNAKWGKKCPPPEVIAAMPPKRQTLFRGVWHGMREIPNVNKYYDEANIGRYV